ncbi:rhomboid family intramembrane serine protease [Bifidobacterium aemilianum]|uniref:Rhomboid family intramembrane serine protease n=1 Tax=Bifidobacterium aemilianum TaxID=2493120 RepID=A0A366K7Z9_9BIFI|nr:rhomboid family intramembrane serine protease [Bifidobacterium aemilianum]RBP97794.1 rhomboid family intramembrane serine protease [Bifidobacterium aemilianum]
MPQISKQQLRYQWKAGGPVIVSAIIAVCLVVWLVEIALYFVSTPAFMAMVGQGAFAPALALQRPWTVLTALFMHAPNLFHVLFNMLALWSVGPLLERLMGHWRFLALYLISGLGGAVGMVVWDRVTGSWLNSAYGASAALFGLFAAVLVVYRRVGADIRSMLIWMAINFAMPLLTPQIAWQEHVGGFIVGGLLTWLLVGGPRAMRKRSLTARMALYGGLLTVILLLVLVLCLPTSPFMS